MYGYRKENQQQIHSLMSHEHNPADPSLAADLEQAADILADQLKIMQVIRHRILLAMAQEVSQELYDYFLQEINDQQGRSDEELLAILATAKPEATEQFDAQYAAAIDAESSKRRAERTSRQELRHKFSSNIRRFLS